MASGLSAILFWFAAATAAAAPVGLTAELERIDSSSDGELGVYVKDLGSGGLEVKYRADRPWYLASTTKIPVAIVLLQKREAGLIDLESELVLKRSDFVDGSGDVNWLEPGARLKVGALLEKMLTKSDSTATDMLIRLIGVEDLNRRVAAIVETGFHPLTTLLQVRFDAYTELHPKATTLSNMDFFELKKKPSGPKRLDFLAERMKVARGELKAPTIEEAFERYYAGHKNSGTLVAFGELLEKLARGKILSKADRDLLLAHMEKMVTGESRLKAGFPETVRFAQKTGTQIRRVCNVGIAREATPRKTDVVIAACLEKFDDQKAAEATLAKVGRSIARNLRLN